MPNPESNERLATIALLAEPLRRALFEYVSRESAPVSRDQAAAALGIARHLASFHLDRLQEAGLLEVEFRRPSGKAGPGAGRPTKYYRSSAREIEVSVPPRRYAFAGGVLAQALGRSARESIPVRDALREAAREAGRELGQEKRARGDTHSEQGVRTFVGAILDEFGYEAEFAGGEVLLSNCPFRALADEDTDLVCGMNLDLLSGLVDGLEVEGASVRLDPAPGRCCVAMSLP